MNNIAHTVSPRTPHVAEQITRVTDLQHRLEDRLSILTERLNPVLRQEPTKGEAAPPSQSLPTPLAQHLNVNAEQLERLVDRVEYLINHVEL